MKQISQRASSIPASLTLVVNDKAAALKAAGHDVIALAGGDPDFATPPHIVQAAFDAIRSGATGYPSPMKGIVPLLEAIAAKMERDSGLILNPLTDIVVTPGGKMALNLALAVLLDPGDEVLYLDPAWVSYPSIIRIHGGVPVPVPLAAADNFTVTAAAIRRHLTPRSKVLMINTPNNPTGRVYTQLEMDAIAQVAREADLYVLTDEIYEKLVFDGRGHIAIAAQPGMAARTLVVNGFSKAYAMTGWRMGYLCGPADVMRVAARLHGQIISSSAHFTMYAAVAALNGPQDAIATMRDSYQARRDFIVPALNSIDGVACRTIEGAFYVMPSFPNSTRNSVELAEALLDLAGVAGTPGAAFGTAAEGHVRFSIATAMSDLERAVERIAQIADQL